MKKLPLIEEDGVPYCNDGCPAYDINTRMRDHGSSQYRRCERRSRLV